MFKKIGENGKFHQGQRVVVINANKYDTALPDEIIEGVVDFQWSDGRVAVLYKNNNLLTTGQMNVHPQDIM